MIPKIFSRCQLKEDVYETFFNRPTMDHVEMVEDGDEDSCYYCYYY
jgi:hypothetical protein